MDKKTFITGCPTAFPANDKILLAHGSGILSNQLIRELFLKEFDNKYLDLLHDGAIIDIDKKRLAFTTDSFVVKPVFFPGGNIGDLAVNGTVNDLLMCGAKPLFISAAFIIEEGFSIDDLNIIVKTMKKAADKCGVKIVTGDTKVVERGKGDKIFINTSGIGIVDEGIDISPKRAEPGDKIILSGTIAEHGLAVFLAREELDFGNSVLSDTASVCDEVDDIFNVTKNIHVLRDPTRGGLAGILNEIADSSGVDILINEGKIRIKDEVAAACEILGFDPLYIANEGKFICILPENESKKVLDKIKTHPSGINAEIIGEVTGYSKGNVTLRTIIGTTRILDPQTNDQLPRIC